VIKVVIDDITDMDVEAFVFDITADAKLGSGYGGGIAVRGGPSIQKALDEIGECPPGKAISTEAGELKAKHIIYINGPKFHEPGTEQILAQAAKAAFAAAKEKGVSRIAFPPIGTGLYQVEAREYVGLKVRMKIDALDSPDEGMQLFWTTSTMATNEPASVKVALIGDGEFHDYLLPVADNSRWKGRITTFRLDPCSHQGAKIEIEEIGLVKR